MSAPGVFHLALPATSANLGPGFDAAALAMRLFLRVSARPAADWAIRASGRDALVCGALERNLLLDTYRGVLAAEGRTAPPLALEIENEIPIGKGCGSSAAARLAGVALAARFGGLGWSAERIFARAAALEGHPDNAAACWWGGVVFAAAPGETGDLPWLQLPTGAAWPLLLAVPPQPLATAEARAVLPATYSRADAVANVQNAMLLAGALAAGRGDLLAAALRDRLHQPFRAPLCPLLGALLPLAGAEGILGAALSGAGPSVLLWIASDADMEAARAAVRAALARAGLEAELIRTGLVPLGPGLSWPR